MKLIKAYVASFGGLKDFKYDFTDGINTIKQAYDLCKTSGIDADYEIREYDDNVKIVIKMRK